MRRAVMTGPTGSIGIALINQCIAERTEVLAICRRGSGRIGNLPQNPLLTVVEADLEELAQLGGRPDSPYDVFYHFGWEGTFGGARNDMALQVRNITHTLDAVSLAGRLGCSAFIGAGSQAEYGRQDTKLRADTPAHPENGYGMAKLCAGQMSRKLCEGMGIRHIWARILSVYGPYDGEGTMIMSALRSMLRGESTAFTPGGQQWDYLYSKDAAQALYLLGDKGRDGKTYCLGGGSARPMAEYIQIMKEETGYAGEPGIGRLAYGPGQVMYLCADIGELTADTGFRPQTDFREGIRRTIRWIRENEEN